jgi:hypothetical protein
MATAEMTAEKRKRTTASPMPAVAVARGTESRPAPRM